MVWFFQVEKMGSPRMEHLYNTIMIKQFVLNNSRFKEDLIEVTSIKYIF